MMKYDRIIAIDPDKDKSGVALLKTDTRRLTLLCKTFPMLIDFLKFLSDVAKRNNETLIVVVEAGWMNKKSNYHDAQGHRAEKIAKDVGANHETGRKIIEMCEHYGIQVVAYPPLIKCWKGRDRKITHEELVAITHIEEKRTNQEERDAALLAWNYANLPIRLPRS